MKDGETKYMKVKSKYYDKINAWEHGTLVMADVGGGNAGGFYGRVYL